MNSTQWWFGLKKGDSGIPNAVISTAEAIESERTTLVNDYRRYASMYKDRSISSFDDGQWMQSTYDNFDAKPVSYNAIRSVIDSLTAKITSRVPAPRFLTSGGSEDLQESARLFEKLVSGVSDKQHVPQKAEEAFRSACLYGIGILKVSATNEGIKVEHVHPSKLIIDNNACIESEPKAAFQKMNIGRHELIAMFPKMKVEIEESAAKSVGSNGSSIRELVEVYEAWRLPVGKEKGRHIICTDNATLLDETWDSKKLPFVFIKYSNDIVSWVGTGLAEMLEGIQFEINELVQKIQRNMHMLSVSYILKHKGSEISDEHLLSNEEFRLVEYVGNVRPDVITPPAVHPQVYQHLSDLWSKAFEISGLSQLSATSQKPSGLNSGVALRTYSDIETIRFSQIAKQWERLFVDVAKAVIDAARMITLREDSYEVKVYKDAIIENIVLNAELLNVEDIEVIDVYPASSLPQTPAARLERVVEMSQAQLISPSEARGLLDFPDLEKSNNLNNAAYEDLEKIFEYFLSSKGEYIEPLPWQDLQTGIRLGTSYYLRAKMDGLSDEKLDRVLRWVADAAGLLNPPQIPPVEPAPMPAPQVEGAGVPTPGQPTPEEIGAILAAQDAGLAPTPPEAPQVPSAMPTTDGGNILPQ